MKSSLPAPQNSESLPVNTPFPPGGQSPKRVRHEDAQQNSRSPKRGHDEEEELGYSPQRRAVGERENRHVTVRDQQQAATSPKRKSADIASTGNPDVASPKKRPAFLDKILADRGNTSSSSHQELVPPAVAAALSAEEQALVNRIIEANFFRFAGFAGAMFDKKMTPALAAVLQPTGKATISQAVLDAAVKAWQDDSQPEDRILKIKAALEKIVDAPAVAAQPVLPVEGQSIAIASAQASLSAEDQALATRLSSASFFKFVMFEPEMFAEKTKSALEDVLKPTGKTKISPAILDATLKIWRDNGKSENNIAKIKTVLDDYVEASASVVIEPFRVKRKADAKDQAIALDGKETAALTKEFSDIATIVAKFIDNDFSSAPRSRAVKDGVTRLRTYAAPYVTSIQETAFPTIIAEAPYITREQYAKIIEKYNNARKTLATYNLPLDLYPEAVSTDSGVYERDGYSYQLPKEAAYLTLALNAVVQIIAKRKAAVELIRKKDPKHRENRDYSDIMTVLETTGVAENIESIARTILFMKNEADELFIAKSSAIGPNVEGRPGSQFGPGGVYNALLELFATGIPLDPNRPLTLSNLPELVSETTAQFFRGPLASRVGKHIVAPMMTMEPEQKKALLTNIHTALGDIPARLFMASAFEDPTSLSTAIAPQIAAQYSEAPDPLVAFLDAIGTQMGADFPLQPYRDRIAKAAFNPSRSSSLIIKPFAAQVDALCDTIARTPMTTNQRDALLTTINTTLGGTLTPSKSLYPALENPAFLSKAIAAHYPDAADPLAAFSTALETQMGENYPLQPYQSPLPVLTDKEQEHLAQEIYAWYQQEFATFKGKVVRTQQDGIESTLKERQSIVSLLLQQQLVEKATASSFEGQISKLVSTIFAKDNTLTSKQAAVAAFNRVLGNGAISAEPLDKHKTIREKLKGGITTKYSGNPDMLERFLAEVQSTMDDSLDTTLLKNYTIEKTNPLTDEEKAFVALMPPLTEQAGVAVSGARQNSAKIDDAVYDAAHTTFYHDRSLKAKADVNNANAAAGALILQRGAAALRSALSSSPESNALIARLEAEWPMLATSSTQSAHTDAGVVSDTARAIIMAQNPTMQDTSSLGEHMGNFVAAVFPQLQTHTDKKSAITALNSIFGSAAFSLPSSPELIEAVQRTYQDTENPMEAFMEDIQRSSAELETSEPFRIYIQNLDDYLSSCGPQVIEAATAKYRDLKDPMGGFLADIHKPSTGLENSHPFAAYRRNLNDYLYGSGLKTLDASTYIRVHDYSIIQKRAEKEGLEADLALLRSRDPLLPAFTDTLSISLITKEHASKDELTDLPHATKKLLARIFLRSLHKIELAKYSKHIASLSFTTTDGHTTTLQGMIDDSVQLSKKTKEIEARIAAADKEVEDLYKTIEDASVAAFKAKAKSTAMSRELASAAPSDTKTDAIEHAKTAKLPPEHEKALTRYLEEIWINYPQLKTEKFKAQFIEMQQYLGSALNNITILTADATEAVGKLGSSLKGQEAMVASLQQQMETMVPTESNKKLYTLTQKAISLITALVPYQEEVEALRDALEERDTYIDELLEDAAEYQEQIAGYEATLNDPKALAARMRELRETSASESKEDSFVARVAPGSSHTFLGQSTASSGSNEGGFRGLVRGSSGQSNGQSSSK